MPRHARRWQRGQAGERRARGMLRGPAVRISYGPCRAGDVPKQRLQIPPSPAASGRRWARAGQQQAHGERPVSAVRLPPAKRPTGNHRLHPTPPSHVRPPPRPARQRSGSNPSASPSVLPRTLVARRHASVPPTMAANEQPARPSPWHLEHDTLRHPEQRTQSSGRNLDAVLARGEPRVPLALRSSLGRQVPQRPPFGKPAAKRSVPCRSCFPAAQCCMHA